MRRSVRDAFAPFTAKFEGVTTFLYLDVKGLVTIGIGNLVDPIDFALMLPFVRPDGEPATRDEIAAEWYRVKGRQDLKMAGGFAFRDVTSIRLTADGVNALVCEKLDANEAHLRARFTEWDDWPADAQLAILSLAWACGPAFNFPKLAEALRSQQFRIASLEVEIDDTGNPGVTPRNKANALLLENAAWVVEGGWDRDLLYWPKRAEQASEDDTPTARELPSDDTLPGLGGPFHGARPDEALEDTIVDYQKREPRE